MMMKIPKQEYTVRVQGTSGQASEDREVDWFGSERKLGLVEQTLRNWVKLAAVGKQRCGYQSCHAGTNGSIPVT